MCHDAYVVPTAVLSYVSGILESFICTHCHNSKEEEHVERRHQYTRQQLNWKQLKNNFLDYEDSRVQYLGMKKKLLDVEDTFVQRQFFVNLIHKKEKIKRPNC